MKHDYLENIKYLTDYTKLSKVMYMNEKIGTGAEQFCIF